MRRDILKKREKKIKKGRKSEKKRGEAKINRIYRRVGGVYKNRIERNGFKFKKKFKILFRN